MSITAAEKRGAIAVAAAALILMGSVHSSNTSWNVNARMALVFAFVERGTFAIDGYDGEHDAFPTMDKAAYNGHFYSDKAIGVSLLGMPVYAAIRAVTAVTGIEWHLQLKIYAIRLLTTSVPAAIALGLMWLTMVRERMPPERAFLAVAAVFFGSWWFGYSTLAMPYAQAIALTLGAVWLTIYPRGGVISARAAVGIGLLCGLTIIFDLTFALMVLPVIVIFLVTVAAYPRPQALRLAAIGAVAGAIPLALYFGYIYSIFERLTIPYYYIVVPLFREGTQQGFLGIGWPQPGAAWFLTIHPYRGVFFWAPWMILALVGCALATRRIGTGRVWGWMGLWGFASYLALASGYYMWWGGWSMGARLMTPMLALVPMGLPELLRRDRAKGWWWAFAAAAVVSIALCLPLSILNPQVEEGNSYELLRWARIGDPLEVPQFRYLKMVYSGEWFGDQIPVPLFMRILPFAASIAAGGILLVAAKQSRSVARSADSGD